MHRLSPVILAFALVSCGGKEAVKINSNSPVGSWTLDVRATVLRDAHPAKATDPAERQRQEEEYLGTDAGKRVMEAVASGLREDLELRGDGTFSMELGSVPMDPREPRKLATMRFGGSWTRDGSRVLLAMETKEGVRIPRSTDQWTFTFGDGRLSFVETGERSQFSRIVLARR